MFNVALTCTTIRNFKKNLSKPIDKKDDKMYNNNEDKERELIIMKTNKKEMYLISWNDDNHDSFYWLNTHLLGCEIDTIIKTVIDLKINEEIKLKQINIYGDTFPEDIWEQLFDYFQTIPKFDEIDVHLIVLDKWEDFYKKNIKKIMRKSLTK